VKATHPERWRDRPVDTSATTNTLLVPIPAETARAEILEDEVEE